MRGFGFTWAWVIVALGVGTRPAAAGPLGVAGDFGEFVLGSSTRSNTDSRGMVAVGGSAVFSNFGVAKSPLVPNTPGLTTLVVGGSLNWANGQLFRGDGAVGGAVSRVGVGTPGGTIAGGVSPLPIDFAAERATLEALSLAQYDAADPTVAPVYGALTFGGSAGLNVFNVGAADFQNAHTYTIDAPAGATVIVNVAGTATDFNNAGVNLTGGIGSAGVLWNFYQATSLTIGGIGINGSVLAPFAAVTFSNGQINGNLIAASLIGGGETHIDQGGVDGGIDARFAGLVRGGPPVVVPEPPGAVLGALGGMILAAAGGLRWRRRLRAG